MLLHMVSYLFLQGEYSDSIFFKLESTIFLLNQNQRSFFLASIGDLILSLFKGVWSLLDFKYILLSIKSLLKDSLICLIYIQEFHFTCQALGLSNPLAFHSYQT